MTSPNLEQVRLQVASQLPIRVRWLIDGTPDDYNFSRASAPLQPLQESEINGQTDNEWLSLHLFGEEDYAEGGGAQSPIGWTVLAARFWGLTSSGTPHRSTYSIPTSTVSLGLFGCLMGPFVSRQ
jgi:hypothetical protein